MANSITLRRIKQKLNYPIVLNVAGMTPEEEVKAIVSLILPYVCAMESEIAEMEKELMIMEAMESQIVRFDKEENSCKNTH